MPSVQVPRDLSLRVFHRLGSNQLVVSLQLAEGDDAFTRILQTFRRAQLPSCFLRSTLEYASLAMRESLADDARSIPFDGIFDSTAPLDVRQLQSRGFMPPDEWPWGIQFHSNRCIAFWCAYDFLLRHRPTFFRTIGTLEDSYLQAIRELFQGRAAATSELQRCQSMEMERLRRESEEGEGGGADIQVLVGQHVSEIEALDRHWQSEIDNLKAKQEASYRDLVVDFFEQEILGETAEPSSSSSAPAPEAYVEPFVETDRLKRLSEVRCAFGRAFVVIRLWVGDVMEFAGGLSHLTGQDADGAGPQLPEPFVGLASYGGDDYVSTFGSWGHPTPRLRTAKPTQEDAAKLSASLRFWPSPQLPRLALSPNAYANRLRGLVLATPEQLQFDLLQVAMRDLQQRLQRTDFHFPSLKRQFEAVGRKDLVAGDYFCTRHSNLGGQLQVAFHLLVASDSHSADELPASLHRAVQRIFLDCHRCHVAEVTLPLLLLDIGTSETALPLRLAQRRAEQVLRLVKTSLTELESESGELGLEVLNLVLPVSALQSAKGTPSVAAAAQSFLLNSFQCV